MWVHIFPFTPFVQGRSNLEFLLQILDFNFFLWLIRPVLGTAAYICTWVTLTPSPCGSYLCLGSILVRATRRCGENNPSTYKYAKVPSTGWMIQRKMFKPIICSTDFKLDRPCTKGGEGKMGRGHGHLCMGSSSSLLLSLIH